MILYTLACDADHRFESWFSDMKAYDALASACALSCPICGSSRVGKAVMAPAVVGAARPFAVEAAEPRTPASHDVALMEPGHREIRALVKAFHAKVIAETQDVGRRFADEARRIHEGEEPHRNIRGEATAEEARGLLDDGILILPVPTPPDDMN